jgi:hypothetical protein
VGKKVYIVIEEQAEDENGVVWCKIELHGDRPGLEHLKEDELSHVEYWGVRIMFNIREMLTLANVIKDEEQRWKLH